MKRLWSLKQVILLSAVSLFMIAVVDFKDAAAYFTTYVSAGGSEIVHMGAQTELHEDVSDMTKHISVTNASQINDCFVRVKVFHGGQLEVTYADRSESGDLWTFSQEDGYWYYGPILPAGASTEILDARIGDLSEDFDRESFQVVVIQECTPVIYDEEGNPAADWNTVYSDYQEMDRQGEGAER